MYTNNETNIHLEKAICLKADAQFDVAIRALTDRPYSEEQSTEYEKNIGNLLSAKSTFFNSEDITCKYYLVPLIEKIISIETELRATYKIPMPPNRREYLREFLRDLVRSKWSHVVEKAQSDAEKQAVFHSKFLPAWIKIEINDLCTTQLLLDPVGEGSRFSSMIDDLVQIAYAESLLYAHQQPQKASVEASGQLSHSVVINNPQNINLNIANTISDVRQSINNIRASNQSDKEDLENLILQLMQELQKAPQERAQDAEVVAEYAKALIDEVSKEKRKKIKIDITKEGLIKAAENIASILPMVFQISKQIVDHVLVSG